MTERIINAERVEQLIDVFGSFDANIKQIEAEFGVKVTNRDTELKIQGDVEQVDYAARAIEALLSLSAKGEEIDAQKVRYLISLVKTGNEDKVGEIAKDVEFLINLTFQLHETFFWSFYPLAAGVILGLMLIVIAICKPLRESLQRKFFL